MFNPDFETEKYRFWFREMKEGFHYFVVVEIARVERGKAVIDEDVNYVQDFFKDIGKWETFVKAGKTLLEDLGIGIETEKTYEEEFGAEKYRMSFEKDDYIKVKIELTPEEGLRRTKGAATYGIRLSKEEILNQVKNIPKWGTLMRAISAFKASSTTQ